AILSNEGPPLAFFSPIFGSIWIQATVIGVSACIAQLHCDLKVWGACLSSHARAHTRQRRGSGSSRRRGGSRAAGRWAVPCYRTRRAGISRATQPNSKGRSAATKLRARSRPALRREPSIPRPPCGEGAGGPEN